MRKMLILMLVLGVVSVASAMNLKIWVDGAPPPQSNAITIPQPSGTAAISINAPEGWASPGASIYWGLVCDPAAGTITATYDPGDGILVPRAIIPPAPDASMGLSTDNSVFFPGFGVYGSIDAWAAVTAGQGTYFDSIVFHCESGADAVVQLWYTIDPDYVVFTLADSVTIHQVPEPTTMILLSLGGLLLRKRGK